MEKEIFIQGMQFVCMVLIAVVMFFGLVVFLEPEMDRIWRKVKKVILSSSLMRSILKNKEEEKRSKEMIQKEVYYATEPDQIDADDPRYNLAWKIFAATHWPSKDSVRTIYEAVKEFKQKFKFHEKLAVVYGEYVDGQFWTESFCSLNSWELTLKAFYQDLLSGKAFTIQQLDLIQHRLDLQLRLEKAYKDDDLTGLRSALDDGADPSYKYYSSGRYIVLNQYRERRTLCQRYLLTLDTENAYVAREAWLKRKAEKKMLEEAENAFVA